MVGMAIFHVCLRLLSRRALDVLLFGLIIFGFLPTMGEWFARANGMHANK
jgi:hypothetical protein